MKILVHPHDLGIGGSQLNAIEIAAAVARLGHPTVVFGRPGPLTDRIAELGLEFVAAPEPRRRPSPATVRALVDLIDSRGIDVLHGYEWPPALEDLLAARRRKVAAVATVMSMSVAPFIPHSMPLVVGTEQIAAVERGKGRTRLHVIEPPVDLVANRPDTGARRAAFVLRWGLDVQRATVVCVSRLAHELKLEGLLAAMDAVAELTRTVPAQLVIVGDGPAADEVRRHAEQVDRRAGAGTVVLTGELPDPRDAYAAADVVLGMGGSALRAMAFGKPVVVQGEQGFWQLLTPDSLASFRWTGWYGRGSDAATGADRLLEILLDVLPDAQRRRQLGRFALSVVQEHHSVEAAAAKQLDVYAGALATLGSAAEGGRVAGDVAAVSRFVVHQGRRRVQRVLGRGATDDFNAAPAGSPALPTGGDGAVLYLAGVSWDAIAGTDQHLVMALARHRTVVWADPAESWLRRLRATGLRRPFPDAALASGWVTPSIFRIRTVAPPGVSRPGIRFVARRLVARNAAVALRRLGVDLDAVVVASPDPLVRTWRSRAATIYFATDDFVAGAGLLGSSARYLRRAQRSNARSADLSLAVSLPLAEVLSSHSPSVALLPNGCASDRYAAVPRLLPDPAVHLPTPIAGVLGQLNERLDLDVLEAVADRGDSLLLIGPRSERTPDATRRLDSLIDRQNVQWLGHRALDQLPACLAAIDVGLTPYTDTQFNRASFPLKTLEYLAAGRPVISTDLPAVRWLDTDLISRADGATDFAETVHEQLLTPDSADEVARRQAFALGHSWDARGEDLHRFIRRSYSRTAPRRDT